MSKELYAPSPKSLESPQAANDTRYNATTALETLPPEEMQNRKKALTWLIGDGNGQNEAQQTKYQAELDRINSILEQ